MCRLLGVLACVSLLSGCEAMPFTPTEYPLRDGLIPALSVSGDVKVLNTQPSTSPTIVYSYGGAKLSSDLKSITEVMVQQAARELEKNGQYFPSSEQKTLSLRVDSLLSEYKFFYWTSNIEFQATLGDGQTIDFKVPHTSGVLVQDLNGCIAEGVLALLRDERVREYLAR